MLVGEWMSKNVISTTEDASMMRARKILKEKCVRRLPVVDAENRLVGIVTERDIMKASPSAATTLDVYEMTYLLSEIKVKDIMVPNPSRIRPTDTVEKAALIMRNKKIGGLPVVDADGKVVGMITDTDIFRLLISITGIDQGGIHMCFKLSTSEGSLKAIMDDLRRHDARIISVLSSYGKSGVADRTVSIRILCMPAALEKQLHDELAEKYALLYWTRDGEGSA
jgi:acetoin utilization protein AcuB